MARRYARDNRGRFASVGATARGGRLKTASGNKRQTQTMRASAAPKGTISKPAGLKPGAIKPKVLSARQEATNRLKIKTETRRKLRADRASVVPAKPSGPKTMKAARPQSTVAKPRTKGNTKAQVARRVERKAAANRANLAAITRAERTGAGQGRQYQRALKRQMTLERAQNYLQTGKLPGRDNSIAAQRKMRQAKDRLAATNAARAASRAGQSAAAPASRRVLTGKGRAPSSRLPSADSDQYKYNKAGYIATPQERSRMRGRDRAREKNAALAEQQRAGALRAERRAARLMTSDRAGSAPVLRHSSTFNAAERALKRRSQRADSNFRDSAQLEQAKARLTAKAVKMQTQAAQRKAEGKPITKTMEANFQELRRQIAKADRSLQTRRRAMDVVRGATQRMEINTRNRR